MTGVRRAELAEVLADLGRLIEALGDYRRDAVLTGGLVPFFYRRLPGFAAPAVPPLLTHDMDWTLPVDIGLRGSRSLAERLADSRFVVIRSTGSEPPVEWYQHERHGRDHLAPIYAEFLAPLVGSVRNRSGKPRTVQVVRAGIAVQALRYLDLLLDSPMRIDATVVAELNLRGRREILLPRPANYVFQKVLAGPERPRDKRDKDLAYIYEVALLTRDDWPGIAAALVRLRGRYPQRWFSRARQVLLRLFASVTSDGPVAVARQYRSLMPGGGAPSERAVHTVITGFLDAIGWLPTR